jgi:serine/threonine protein kinase
MGSRPEKHGLKYLNSCTESHHEVLDILVQQFNLIHEEIEKRKSLELVAQERTHEEEKVQLGEMIQIGFSASGKVPLNQFSSGERELQFNDRNSMRSLNKMENNSPNPQFSRVYEKFHKVSTSLELFLNLPRFNRLHSYLLIEKLHLIRHYRDDKKEILHFFTMLNEILHELQLTSPCDEATIRQKFIHCSNYCLHDFLSTLGKYHPEVFSHEQHSKRSQSMRSTLSSMKITVSGTHFFDEMLKKPGEALPRYLEKLYCRLKTMKIIRKWDTYDADDDRDLNKVEHNTPEMDDNTSKILLMDRPVTNYAEAIQRIIDLHSKNEYFINYSVYEPNFDDELGQGHFGYIISGKYDNKHVAIKCFKDLFMNPTSSSTTAVHFHNREDDAKERKVHLSIIRETLLGHALDDHPNILKFVAADFRNGIIILEKAVCSLSDFIFSLTEINELNEFITFYCRQQSASSLQQEQWGNGPESISHAKDNFTEEYPFNSFDIYQLFHDIAKGLAYLHLYNIVHRDIKPGNILLFLDPNYRTCSITGSGSGSSSTIGGVGNRFKRFPLRAKICDFGLAKILDSSFHDEDKRSNHLERFNGTLQYSAPEILALYYPLNKHRSLPLHHHHPSNAGVGESPSNKVHPTGGGGGGGNTTHGGATTRGLTTGGGTIGTGGGTTDGTTGGGEVTTVATITAIPSCSSASKPPPLSMHYSNRTDVFSLGILMIETMTREAFWKIFDEKIKSNSEKSDELFIQEVLDKQFRPSKANWKIRSELDQEIYNLVGDMYSGCVAEKPEDRYSIEQVNYIFEKFYPVLPEPLDYEVKKRRSLTNKVTNFANLTFSTPKSSLKQGPNSSIYQTSDKDNSSSKNNNNINNNNPKGGAGGEGKTSYSLTSSSKKAIDTIEPPPPVTAVMATPEEPGITNTNSLDNETDFQSPVLIVNATRYSSERGTGTTTSERRRIVVLNGEEEAQKLQVETTEGNEEATTNISSPTNPGQSSNISRVISRSGSTTKQQSFMYNLLSFEDFPFKAMNFQVIDQLDRQETPHYGTSELERELKDWFHFYLPDIPRERCEGYVGYLYQHITKMTDMYHFKNREKEIIVKTLAPYDGDDFISIVNQFQLAFSGRNSKGNVCDGGKSYVSGREGKTQKKKRKSLCRYMERKARCQLSRHHGQGKEVLIRYFQTHYCGLTIAFTDIENYCKLLVQQNIYTVERLVKLLVKNNKLLDPIIPNEQHIREILIMFRIEREDFFDVEENTYEDDDLEHHPTAKSDHYKTKITKADPYLYQKIPFTRTMSIERKEKLLSKYYQIIELIKKPFISLEEIIETLSKTDLVVFLFQDEYGWTLYHYVKYYRNSFFLQEILELFPQFAQGNKPTNKTRCMTSDLTTSCCMLILPPFSVNLMAAERQSSVLYCLLMGCSCYGCCYHLLPSICEVNCGESYYCCSCWKKISHEEWDSLCCVFCFPLFALFASCYYCHNQYPKEKAENFYSLCCWYNCSQNCYDCKKCLVPAGTLPTEMNYKSIYKPVYN